MPRLAALPGTEDSLRGVDEVHEARDFSEIRCSSQACEVVLEAQRLLIGAPSAN